MDKFTEKDFDFFFKHIYENIFSKNNGGMKSPDLFSLFFALKKLKPKVVIESGVWNGLSTKLIRKTLGEDVTIICLDPRNIPLARKNSPSYRDSNKNTKYLIGKDFIDFSLLDISKFKKTDIFCFFDCHQNAVERMLQAYKKGIKHIFYNDNYPKYCGSHFTMEHLLNNDYRKCIMKKYDKNKIISKMKIYHIFPNIYPGRIQTGEGLFVCKAFYKELNDNYTPFKNDRNAYRWNTYIELK